MDWQKRMNQAMDYIESNLTEDINYSSLARIINCSDYEFRRMFSFLAQMSLSEYVRKRRISASLGAIKSGEKIIDIAQRYGYDSHAAFSRAFKQFTV